MVNRAQTRAKMNSKRKKVFRRIFSLLFIAVICTAGYYAYHLYRFTTQIHVEASKAAATKAWNNGRVNILLMGGDARPKDKSANSDSMILISADPKTHQVKMFSILRDTFWKIPGYSYQKMNAANLLGGTDLAVQTVENFLDIPINYYVKTDFQGFSKMVDILGGVNINVEEDMNYDDPTDGTSIHLKQGEQHLNGKQALDFARFRHDAMGDFNRTKHQRELLKAIAQQSLSSVNFLKVPQILDALAPYIQTNMDTTDMLKIAKLLYGVKSSDIQMAQVPQMNDILQKSIPRYGEVLIPNVLAVRQYVHDQLNMDDTVTATANEQYYWNLYSTTNVHQPTVSRSTTTLHQRTTHFTTTTTTSAHAVESRAVTRQTN